MENYHKPVMLRECIEGLNINPDGIYVDVTFGGGGHSSEIVKRLDKGKLYAFDRDRDALKNAQHFDSEKFQLIEANFRYIKKQLRLYGVRKVDGILADLGVSSHQFDTGSRGFSTRFEGPLDMRMDQSQAISAATIVNEYEFEDLKRIFKLYGELKNASKLASEIIKHRSAPIETTEQLKTAIENVTPKFKEFKYLAQVFQALRIEVNEELKALEELLVQSGELINEGGRLAVISFHSLEDRMVKNYIRSGHIDGTLNKDFYGNVIKPFEAVNRKPIEASEEEKKSNNRSRSARLRVAERVYERK